MADIDPMSLDRTTDFTSVGGLDDHIHSLREMVVFPMLYPDVFEKFNIAPPRGVIFYGSPGTGKTLVSKLTLSSKSEPTIRKNLWNWLHNLYDMMFFLGVKSACTVPIHTPQPLA